MYHLRRLTISFVSLGVIVGLLWLLPQLLNPTPPSPEQKRRDEAWVRSSPYWFDRQACRVLGLCGLQHLRRDRPELAGRTHSNSSDGTGDLRLELRSLSEPVDSRQWRKRESLGDESWEIAGASMTRRDAPSANAAQAIPDYVLAYAPLVHLYSDEHFWPSNIADHISHMEAYAGSAKIPDLPPLSLDTLAQLNNKTSRVFLTSLDDVEDRPEWLHSHANRPVAFADGDGDESKLPAGHEPAHNPFPGGTTWFDVDRDHPLHHISDPRKTLQLDKHPRRWGPEESRLRRELAESLEEAQQKLADELAQQGHKPDESGYTKAPAILVMVDKGSGILDAFWFFFYSYNLGQTVLGVRYGNHVGDWEHCMIRFEGGVPRALFLSEHEGGQAYAWSALEKMQPQQQDGDASVPPLPERPVIYSAVGSHAMYAVPGPHPYVLPFHMLKDETDKGPLWDPAKNNLAYFYDYVAGREEGGRVMAEDGDEAEEIEVLSVQAAQLASLVPAASNPDAPTSWFHYDGTWGDEVYELADKRQWRLFGQYHYLTGPQGPKFKNLERQKVCQTQRCRLLYNLQDSGTWYR